MGWVGTPESSVSGHREPTMHWSQLFTAPCLKAKLNRHATVPCILVQILIRVPCRFPAFWEQYFRPTPINVAAPLYTRSLRAFRVGSSSVLCEIYWPWAGFSKSSLCICKSLQLQNVWCRFRGIRDSSMWSSALLTWPCHSGCSF